MGIPLPVSLVIGELLFSRGFAIRIHSACKSTASAVEPNLTPCDSKTPNLSTHFIFQHRPFTMLSVCRAIRRGIQTRMVSFAQLGVNPALVSRLASLNITQATQIQEKERNAECHS